MLCECQIRDVGSMRVCRLRSDSDSVAVVKPASEVSRLYRAGLASGSDSAP